MLRRRISILLRAAWLLTVGASGLPVDAAASPVIAPPPHLRLAPCKLPGIERQLRCGRFDVFEDRARQAGRTISLRVVVLPASSLDHAADPIFVFEGGPGASAVESAAGEFAANADLNRTRDIVLVDVRGTGDSNGLHCKSLQGHKGVLGFLEDFMPVEGVRACRRELEKRANLKFYTTTSAVDDVDDIRAALGYDRINLEGDSYGTFAALNYMRRHPAHVRTAVLQGIVPPDTRMPLYFARDAQTALDQLLAACATDIPCHTAFPDPAGEIDRLLAKLERQPVEVTVKEPRSGQQVKLVLGRSAVAQTIRYMLYTPVTAAQIPLQIHLAAQGNFAPIAEGAYFFGNFATSLSEGFYLSVTCAEDVPLYTLDAAAKAAKGTFLGDFRARAQKAACAAWPQGETPAGFTQPVRSETPTLLFSGERDPVTPATWAEQAARTLPHSRHIVVQGGGHGFGGEKGIECLDRITTDFIQRGSEKNLDTSCAARIEPVPFALSDERP